MPVDRDRAIPCLWRQSRGKSKAIPTAPGNRICAGLRGGAGRTRTGNQPIMGLKGSYQGPGLQCHRCGTACALRRPDHHGPGREGPDSPVAGEARRGRARSNMRVCGYGGWSTSSRALFATGLLRHPLAEPDAGALPVLIDEEDAGGFEGASNNIDRRAARLARTSCHRAGGNKWLRRLRSGCGRPQRRQGETDVGRADRRRANVSCCRTTSGSCRCPGPSK
jgi:hypothetical protein